MVGAATFAFVLVAAVLAFMVPAGGAAGERTADSPRTHFQWFKVIQPSTAGTRLAGPRPPGSALAITSITVAPGEPGTVSLMRRGLTEPSAICEGSASPATLTTFSQRDESTHLVYPEPFVITASTYWCAYVRTSALRPLYVTVVGYTY
jgi:hypothetical protein